MSGFVSKMAEWAPSWNLVQPVINIPKINRAPAKLFEKVSRGSTISKGRNNPPDLRHTHSASAKNCFQAPPRSLYGVNYLLMRDVLVTFMYVQLAGGRLSARSADAASPRSRLCPACGADRRLFRPDTAAAATTTHVQCAACACAADPVLRPPSGGSAPGSEPGFRPGSSCVAL